MFPFEYDRPTQQERVIDALSHSNRTKILAGGTNLAGSMTTASVVPAVQAAATQLKAKLQGRSANFDSNAGVIIEAVAESNRTKCSSRRLQHIPSVRCLRR